ncbi:hypothetical protein [Niastella populi]|uniref:Uncharacterized protein n=1 Tax=Niastella populi TaxID=550983 RepID=A0A1V9FHZ0_9BACT|nr:hypothetical protein [Niastella populi]OQP57891.1 hypothetical protein A4R26_23585 [Niastella populi]
MLEKQNYALLQSKTHNSGANYTNLTVKKAFLPTLNKNRQSASMKRQTSARPMSASGKGLEFLAAQGHKQI